MRAERDGEGKFGGAKAEGFKLRGDVMRGFFEFGRAGGAAFQLGRCEVADMREIELRVDIGGVDDQAGAQTQVWIHLISRS